MPVDQLFTDFAQRLATAISTKPETFSEEVAAFAQSLTARTQSGQGKANGIAPGDISGLTQVGIQVARAVLATTQRDLGWIEQLVASPSAALRCCAAMALGEIGNTYPQEIVALAYRLAQDPVWEVREFVANAFDDRMGEAQGDFVYQLMQEWVKDTNENVRRVPTNALMRYGRRHPERVLELMQALRHDPSLYVRKNVCFCVGIIALERHPSLGYPNPENPTRVFALLRNWVQDPDERTRWIVAETLGRAWSKSDPQETLHLLYQLAADSSTSVRRTVVTSLRAICKRDVQAKTQIEAWLHDQKSLVRETAALL